MDPAADRHRTIPSTTEPRRPDAAELSSQTLLRGRSEVLIRHGDELYRLRQTRNDKLILTK